MPIKAVLFDVGGVIVGSPLTGIRRYEKEHGLPLDYLNVGITARGDKGAFQRLERSEVTIWEFLELFGEELSDTKLLNKWYEEHCKKRNIECPSLPKSVKVNGKELWETMMKEAGKVDSDMEAAIKRLRASGKFKIAALTNNHIVPEGQEDPRTDRSAQGSDLKGPPLERLKGYFDVFLESSVLGLRKPDPRIFQHTLKELGCDGSEVVFLDDIGINLKAAQKLGIKTIRVVVGNVRHAVTELEQVIGMRLLDDDPKSRL